MTISLKLSLALSAIAGVALTGCAARLADASPTADRPTQTISVVIHQTNLDFVTPGRGVETASLDVARQHHGAEPVPMAIGSRPLAYST